MTTRTLIHEEVFVTDPATLFATLCTPAAIRGWWQAATAIVVPRAGGKYIVSWGDNENDPEYVTLATITVFAPGRELVLSGYDYYAKEGNLPFDADMEVAFHLQKCGHGTLLRVTQTGIPLEPVADDFFAGCKEGWRSTFGNLRSYAEER